VTVVTEEFRNLYRLVTKSLGLPALPAVWIQHPIVSVQHAELRTRAELALPAIVGVITGANDQAHEGGGQPAAATVSAPAAPVVERITVDDSLEAVYERLEAEGWTDGLPIVPPTEARVARMLAYTDLEPADAPGADTTAAIIAWTCDSCADLVTSWLDWMALLTLVTAGATLLDDASDSDDLPPHPEHPAGGTPLSRDDLLSLHELLASDSWFDQVASV